MKPEKISFFNKWFAKTLGRGLYAYQTKLLEPSGKYRIVNKSRQTGISTFLAAYGCYKAMIGQRVLIVSPSERQSKHVMDMVVSFLANVKHDKPIEETKTSIRWEHGGEIRSLPNSPSTGRGFTADLIVFDEYAHFLNGSDNDIMTSIAPALSRGGELWLVSTPFGERGLFHEYWSKNNNFSKVLINWRECPDLKETTLRELCPDPLSFDQEYENKFLSDIETEFPWDLLHRAVDPDLQYESVLTSNNVYGGMDIGRTVDQTAIVCVSKNDDCFTVCFKNTMLRTDFEAQQHFAETLLKSGKVLRFNIDASGMGQQIGEALQKRHGHIANPLQFSSELKEALVTRTKGLLADTSRVRLRMPDDPQLLNALHGIKRVRSSTGFLKFDSDRTDLTGHSDTAWALMLALYEPQRVGLMFGTLSPPRNLDSFGKATKDLNKSQPIKV